MANPPRVGIIMAGGSGERFWPLSSGDSPKQLLKLTHPVKNMLQEAIERLDGVVDEIFVSTTTKLIEPIKAHGAIEASHILAEPAKRNTLGALVWVVAELEARGLGNASIAVVTADHYIGMVEEFSASVKAALDFAEKQHGIVTFGIRPTRPETGYGYIELDASTSYDLGDGRVGHKAGSFREKPDLETAYEYLASGKFLWNSGMFYFTLEDFKRELAAVQPGAAVVLGNITEALKNGNDAEAKSHFEQLENVSIDYAVMEKVSDLYVLPVEFPWDDVGAWDALERTGDLTEHQNSVRGEPILVDVTNSVVVQADDGIQVSVLGVTDLIVVSTGTAVLVCHKTQAQRVRELARIVASRAVVSPT